MLTFYQRNVLFYFLFAFNIQHICMSILVLIILLYYYSILNIYIYNLKYYNSIVKILAFILVLVLVIIALQCISVNY